MAVSTSKLSGGIGVVHVRGNLVGGEETTEFRNAVTELLEQHYQKLVLDLKEVAFMNSTGLGVLIAAHTSSLRKGCHIILCNVSNGVHSVLAITKLNLILDERTSREEAIHSLA